MLTERMQRVYVYRLLQANADPAQYPVEWLDKPWRQVVSALARVYEEWGAEDLDRLRASKQKDSGWTRDEIVLSQAWTEDTQWCLNFANELDEDPHHVALRQKLAETPGVPCFPSLAEIEHMIPEPAWLWPSWIPRGMLTVLGGFQGTGKSMFTMDLARTVIHGGTWPDGVPVERSGPVVYIDAEGIPQENAKRARTLGLDRSQLFLLYASEGQMLDLVDRAWRDQVVEITASKRPELVIVDSLSSASSSGQDRPEQVNPLMMFLAGLARRHDCGVILLHHLRKPSGQLAFPLVTIHEFAGSRHITAMARSVLGLSVMQHGKSYSLNGPRRLDLCKTNVADEYPDAIGLKLVPTGDGRKVFEYGEAPSVDGGTTRDECSEWLIDLLDDGPMPMKEILAAGEQVGFNKSMIWRARKTMAGQIVDTKGRQNPANQWALASWEDNETKTEDAWIDKLAPWATEQVPQSEFEDDDNAPDAS